MIKRYIETYNFEKVNFKDISDFGYSKEGFVIKIKLCEQPCYAAEIFFICFDIEKVITKPYFLILINKNIINIYLKPLCKREMLICK